MAAGVIDYLRKLYGTQPAGGQPPGYTDPMGNVADSGGQITPKGRTSYVIEPDLAETQSGWNLPDDVTLDESGTVPLYKDNRQAVPIVRRPNVLPLTPTPDGVTFAMPRVLDLLSNAGGGGKIPVAGGEVALGAGKFGRRALTAEEIAEATARAERPAAARAPSEANVAAAATRAEGGPVPSSAPMDEAAVAAAAERAEARLAEEDAKRYQHAVPQYAEQYPEAGGFKVSPKTAQKGKKPPPAGSVFEQKVRTAEERELMAARKKVVADMDSGEWTPYFDIDKRADVDPANYPRPLDTTDVATAKTQAARDRHYANARNPEGLQRLRNAYEHGERLGGAGDWYFMKQLEDKFIAELGETEGRRQFQQKFAGAMASTTAGMSPTNNLLAAHYGNYLREKGMAYPEKAHQVPSPMGGPYMQANLAEHEKTFVGPNAPGTTANAAKNPKRYDFEWDFLGHDNAVIDKQMSQLFGGEKLHQPPDYGQYGRVLRELAAEYGVSPRYFQEVAWGGAKNLKTRKDPVRDPNIRWNDTTPDYGGGFEPKPMMQIVNETIERTSRLTGRTPEDVLIDSLIRSKKPLYSRGSGRTQDEENR